MSNTKRARLARHNNVQFAQQLSIERCQGYISHMQALLYVCEGAGEELTEALQQVIVLLDLELSYNLKRLS